MVRGANRRREDTRRAQPPLLRLPNRAAVSDSGGAAQSAQRASVEQPDRVSCEGVRSVSKQTPTAARQLHTSTRRPYNRRTLAATPAARRHAGTACPAHQGMVMSLRLERMLAMDAAIRGVL